MLLTKQQILSKNDLVLEKVKCPEWGGDVYVRNMSGRTRQKFELEYQKNDDGKEGSAEIIPDMRAKLACLTVCDAKGKLLFDYKDFDKLAEKSCSPLERIFTVSLRLNGLSDDDVKELEGK